MQVDEGSRGRHRIAGGIVQQAGGISGSGGGGDRQLVEVRVAGTGHDGVELVVDERVVGCGGGYKRVVGQEQLGGHGIVMVVVVHWGSWLVDQLVQGLGVGIGQLGGGD